VAKEKKSTTRSTKKKAARKAPSKPTVKKSAAKKAALKKSARKAAAPRAAAKGAARAAKTAKTAKKVKPAAPAEPNRVKVAAEKPAVEPKPTKALASKRGAVGKTVGGKRAKSVAAAASTAAADEKGYVFINGRRVRMISTQGLPIPKKSRNQETANTSEPETEPARPLKTRLSKKELAHYRDLLLIKRAELVGDLSAMEAEALRSSGGNISHMPIHMADIGTDTYDQDFMLGLAEAERRQLREIDAALQRIEDGTYGVCHMTGKDIPKARLDAKPWAKYTIEAARLVETQWQR
jgi:DnaK suppressor protein